MKLSHMIGLFFGGCIVLALVFAHFGQVSADRVLEEWAHKNGVRIVKNPEPGDNPRERAVRKFSDDSGIPIEKVRAAWPK